MNAPGPFNFDMNIYQMDEIMKITTRNRNESQRVSDADVAGLPRLHSCHGVWTQEEDERLRKLVEAHGMCTCMMSFLCAFNFASSI